MALVEVTNLREVDTFLSASRTRNTGLKIYDREAMFKDPTIFFKDDTTGALHAFSRRQTYWTWSFATMSSKTPPTRAELQSLITTMETIATSRFGSGLPFSAYFSENCPFIGELTNGRTDLTIIDRVVQAVNAWRPGLAIRLDPPVDMTITLGRKTVHLGLVYAHTVPLIVE